MIFFILCKTEFEFFIKLIFIYRLYYKLQIYGTSFNLVKCNSGVFNHNIPVLDFICTHGIQFSDRNLVQSSVFHRHFSRKAHLCKPFRFISAISKSIPVLHPGNHNSSSIWSKQCLHCITVNSIIHTLIRLFLQSMCLRIQISYDT